MIQEFIGKFHPLLVHLPIGILVLAILLKIINIKQKNAAISQLMPTILLIAFVSSVLSCLTGYLLYDSGGYEAELVEKHQWSAIFLTIFCGLLYFLRSYTLVQQLGWIMLAMLLIITGHLGGSLTHGENFLALSSEDTKSKKKTISNIQEALVYQDIIEPILQEKCYTCHSSKKQKGDLRLDTQEFILKGGEHPNCLVPNDANNSLLYKRLILNESDEEHMPPKGKPQLEAKEIKLINWWIAEGAHFNKKIKDLKQNAEISGILNSFGQEETQISNIPLKEVEAANPNDIQKLKDLGIVVTPVGLNSNYLMVNMTGNKKINDNTISEVLKLKNQLVWLKAGDISIGDAGLKTISELKNLTQLSLNQTKISDKGLENLAKLENLQSLNLTQTDITEKGLVSLKALKNLKNLYLFETKIDKKQWASLASSFPKTKIDSGGYLVPTLASDTTQIVYVAK